MKLVVFTKRINSKLTSKVLKVDLFKSITFYNTVQKALLSFVGLIVFIRAYSIKP